MTKRKFVLFMLAVFAVLAWTVSPVAAQKPNIVIIWGDDIGQSNISAYTKGLMGYKTPNIDRVAKEGMIFTDYYAEQSRAALLAVQPSLWARAFFAPASAR